MLQCRGLQVAKSTLSLERAYHVSTHPFFLRNSQISSHSFKMIEFVSKASARTSEALALPPKWLAAYSDFIIKNASAVSQIESALRSLTYIIPGRFRESEIASESLHSSV